MPRKKYFDWKGSRTTDAEFVSLFAQKLEVSPARAKDIINIFIDCVKECIDNNLNLAIRRFGVFTIRPIRNSKFFNRATQTFEKIPLMHRIRFKPSQSWRNHVNALVKDRLKKKSEEVKEFEKESFEL